MRQRRGISTTRGTSDARAADQFLNDLMGAGHRRTAAVEETPTRDPIAAAADLLVRARDELRARFGGPAAQPTIARPAAGVVVTPAPAAAPPRVVARENATTTFFKLRVDADRDGSVDGSDPPTRWTWGASGRGAVVLPNFDADGSGAAIDAANRTIDGGDDAANDVAPLVIEPVSGARPPSGTQLEITVSPPDVLRIFDGNASGATEIIGPTAGSTHRFARLPTSPLRLGMEALRYAGTGFDGVIEITLRTILASGTRVTQRTCVRVAPWIMPNHTHAAEKVFVVDAGPFNARFRRDLGSLVTAAGCTLVEHAEPGDIWMQDALEFGVSNLPARGFRTVFRAARNRALRTFPRTLLAPQLGYTEQGTLSPDTTFDSHGNLEASPAVTVGGKFYRFGRIYYGPGRPYEQFDTDVRNFLRAQVVQEPFEIDTSWLVVGHVDEVVSFVPTNATTGNRFKLLIASPRKAYAILDRLARTNPTAVMFTGRSLDGSASLRTDVRTFLTVRDDIHPALRANIAAGLVSHTPRTLRAYNDDRQRNLDTIRATMVRELGLVDTDIIEIPAIFMPNPEVPSLADALVPGMVNMIVANRHCIVPKPFGPLVGTTDAFEEDVRTSLGPLGLTVSFLDCWDEYHVNLGEVHCATNTLRTPNRGRWWLFQP